MPDTLACERIDASARDGTKLPLVMLYDKRFYNEKSPWLFKTRGSTSSKEDLAFRSQWLSLTDRGIVICFPLTRGKLLAGLLRPQNRVSPI